MPEHSERLAALAAALVASRVRDMEVGSLKLSARNVLEGTVKAVKQGAVNTEVVLELPGGTEVVSVITRESAQHLDLAKGRRVYAVIKASNVILAVD